MSEEISSEEIAALLARESMSEGMTREEAIRCLSVHSSINGSGLCTDKQHYEAKQVAIKALEQAPCEDAISRQAILYELEQDQYHDEYCAEHGIEPSVSMELVRARLHDLPSVIPSRPIGRWIGIDEEPHEDYECNRCGYVCSTFTANIKPHNEYKYCPNCGAHMVESEE